MDELDFLKQHWKKDEDFPKVDKEGIRKMLHNSSSSIVKWIFYISILELLAGLALNFLLPNDTDINPDSDIVSTLENALSVVFYIVIAYFIYKFFSSYRSIKNTSNTKVLLRDIIETRKAVDQYIRFNIYYIITVSALVTVTMMITDGVFVKPWGEAIFYVVGISIFMIIAIAILLGLVKFYYKVVYRRLVNKLNKNYEQLVQLDEQEEVPTIE
ncbi:hypothetical protein [Sphingobacterium hotanense]|uniref:Beta-carotene 15,15'-monooxygenase n=1 Tax=Sphingobacterium hotanense TaxID=649196 RepID=A0ABT7NQL9_9SPHI|nr:hypothetical protein [Sphingobacterium hotanense]MDM1049537.1 hypothetical protein [Sphingobacterium hotanense]